MASENDIPEREQQVVNLLRAAALSERAPERLQTHVSALKERSAQRPRRNPLPRRAFNLMRFGMPTAAAGIAALVLALGGGAGAPSLAQAAALATRAPTSPAPATDPSDPAKLLTAKVGTLHFPNWRSFGGWRAVGERVDQIGDRTATTVYYSNGSSRIGYSIVSSPKLAGLKTGDEPYATMSNHGRTTVIWEQAGHTCLLTGSGISAVSLWRLASYGFHRAL
ncbi:MAG TPA: hypothetical protein VHU61_01655 [Solirubrobacteraceae bacterium]|nr:hypothetical protein [Solirubrobacteraceae bacterium]